MKAPLGKGIFLIAAPSLLDPNFRQTVVLLCEHGAEGALGVVVNRPTAMSVSEALPQVPILEGQGHVLFSGGPVQTNQVMMLYRLDQLPENSHHVFDGSIIDERTFAVIGGKAEAVQALLKEKAWTQPPELRDALALCITALEQIGNQKLSLESLEVAVLDRTRDGRRFRRLSPADTKPLLSA